MTTSTKSTARRPSSSSSRKTSTAASRTSKTSAAKSTAGLHSVDALVEDEVLQVEDDAPAARAAADVLAEEVDDDDDLLHDGEEDGETGSSAEAEDIAIQSMPEMKKKELIEQAVERSGVKKRDAKPAIEAALAILGEALAEGRELNLIPMGKVKVTRMKKAGNGQIIMARVRRPEQDEIDLETPLAQAAE